MHFSIRTQVIVRFSQRIVYTIHNNSQINTQTHPAALFIYATQTQLSSTVFLSSIYLFFSGNYPINTLLFHAITMSLIPVTQDYEEAHK